jgi:lipopolysaccharide cholinephosphotransferase
MEKDVRKVQLLQLKIAKEIKRICEKNNIKYFLMAGSMLGAIRHGGFIPWDDDMDIGMERGEYEKFLKAVESDLGSEFYMQTWDKEEHYAYPFGKMMLKDTVWLEKVVKDVKITHGIYVDIFPYDAIPNSDMERNRQNKKHIFYRQLLLAINKYDAFTYKKGYKKAVFAMLRGFSFLFSNTRIKENYKKVIAEGHRSDSEDYFAFGIPYTYAKGQMKREWVENLKPIQFEDDFFLAPKDADAYLSFLYGDYMTPPPIEKRTNYHGIIDVDLGKYE